MCLIVVCGTAQGWWLAANRDEAHARPSAALARWDAFPACAGGRDLRAGGSWLLACADGRVAAVTNLRGGGDGRRSRGELPAAFLSSGMSAREFLAQLRWSMADYAPFNLLLRDAAGWLVLSSASGRIEALPAEGFALSNGDPRSPWPKMRWSLAALRRLRRRGARPESAFGVLRRRRPFADQALPSTGLGLRLERALSAPFVRLPGYGTRCSTIVVGGAGMVLKMIERRYDAAGRRCGQSRIELSDT